MVMVTVTGRERWEVAADHWAATSELNDPDPLVRENSSTYSISLIAIPDDNGDINSWLPTDNNSVRVVATLTGPDGTELFHRPGHFQPV